MLALAFLQWWYGPGWKRLAHILIDGIHQISRTFSVTLLLQTLFSPWRRIITYKGESIRDNAKAALDNLISRIVGGVVRIVVLVAALVVIVVVGVMGALWLLLWPFMPVLGIVLIIRGILPW